MKRLMAIFLAVLMLAGCKAAPQPEGLEDALAHAVTVEVGTAGSSLKAAYAAAMLMDWSAGYPDGVDEQAVADIVGALAAADDPNAPASFLQRMAAVDAMHRVLLTEDGGAVLSDCGYGGEGGWTAADLAAYEAVMTACGLR